MPTVVSELNRQVTDLLAQMRSDFEIKVLRECGVEQVRLVFEPFEPLDALDALSARIGCVIQHGANDGLYSWTELIFLKHDLQTLDSDNQLHLPDLARLVSVSLMRAANFVKSYTLNKGEI